MQGFIVFFLFSFIGFISSFAFGSQKSNSYSHSSSSFQILATKESPQLPADSSSKSKVKSWEFGRFIKTLSFYDVLKPKFRFLPFRSKQSDSLKVKKGFQLWSPTNKNLLKWGPLDDVVMGGRSKSDLQFGSTFDGTWTGISTSEGGGGFTGIRTKLLEPPLDVTETTGIEITVKGDGQRYKFIARWDEDWNGLAWSYSFDTIKDKSIKVKIPFNQLKATRFAKVIPDATFNKATLRALQISLSKFEYDGGLNPKWREGPFQLNVESIAAY